MQNKFHPKWKGGKYIDNKGRIWLTTKEYGQILESHYIFMKFHNLNHIPEGYIIHHIDHNPKNNDINNLELMTLGNHSSHHNEVMWANRKNKTKVVNVVKYTDEVKAKVVEMARSGVALAEIQRQLGPNPKAIQRYCAKAGVELPKREKVAKAPKKAKQPKN